MIGANSALPDSGYLSPDSGVGFDTIAVRGLTTMANLSELERVWHQQDLNTDTGELWIGRPGGDARVIVGSAAARVKISSTPDPARASMRVEISAPRMFLGHNWDGVSLDMLDDAVDELLTRMGDHFLDVPKPDEVHFTRLDLTRDFLDVRNSSATLAAISAHHVRHATTHEKYRRHGSELQTLIHGSGRYWRTRGYDKVYEQRGSSFAPPDRATQLRFELQLRSRGLRRHGLVSIADLMSADLTSLARTYFERCNYEVNTAMTNATDVFDAMTDAGITRAEIKNVQLVLFAEQHGCTPMLSKNPFQRARALINRYKLTPETLGPTSFVRRLDFETGTEVTD